MNTTHPPEDHAKPFAQFLREHGRGRTHDELSEGLHQLIARVRDTGKKGSITLTVAIEPMKKDDRMVVVSDKITLKLPEHDRPAGVWFVDPRTGQLTRNDPDQPALDGLVVVDTSSGEIVDTYNREEKHA